MQLYYVSATKSTAETVSGNLGGVSVFTKVTVFNNGLKLFSSY